MGLSNDERGWIMTCISGIACVLGASIICADLIVRSFPGKRNFRIQDSDAFLSASSSSSFGVMLFSALYSMLPSAKDSSQRGGFSPKAAAWTSIGCFSAGAIGIQIISRVLHNFMPSHVVDCEHTHDEESNEDTAKHDHHDHNHDHHDHSQRRQVKSGRPRVSSHTYAPRWQRKNTDEQASYFVNGGHSNYAPTEETERDGTGTGQPSRRPSLHTRLTAKLSQLTNGTKSECDCDGPCYGFTDPCGQECFKIVQARGSRGSFGRSMQRPVPSRSATTTQTMTETTPLLRETIAEEASDRQGTPLSRPISESLATDAASAIDDEQIPGPPSTIDGPTSPLKLQKTASAASTTASTHHPQHHHHVPTNAFMSIGLQTSIAIALHKSPEGFITYATNHANPTLGFSVFLALFIHNITEGFAMASPLYLAINSRWKAMFWSALSGGFSQPLGAGVAASWFKVAGRGDMAPGEGVYGGMFAVTAGIMTSVASQLFQESLDLTHNRGLCMVFAFVGMGISGVSSALTAK